MRYKEIQLNLDYRKVGAEQDGYQPMLYAYLLDESPELPGNAVRPVVIICPGGGYRFKSDREAEPIAMRLLAAGIHAFVLQYSVAPSRYPSAALELAAAVRLVRRNADEFSVDANQISVMGFSAGGHLCATLGTLWDEPVFSHLFGTEQGKDWRPDGMLLCYPVITMGEYTHEGSRDNLLGMNASRTMVDALSLEKRVSPMTPPVFLWHTVDDETVLVENSMLFAAALRKVGIPFEMHLYENGTHGLSLCDETTAEDENQLSPDNAGWMELAIRWIKRGESRAMNE
ncbi:MAG: alpha/beta hydrolase [Eubacteriales bacterium]|nr:alpha/beta hydrolase [Eubacteriales bacterium]